MKTLLKLFVITAAFFSVSTLAAQKIAFVNVQGVLQTLPQTEAIAQAIQVEYKDRLEAVKKLQEDINYNQEKLKRDGATMSQAEKDELLGKTQTMFASLQQDGGQLQKELQARQSEEQRKLLALIKQAIDAVAQEGEYDLVLSAENLVFAKPEFDISKAVFDRVSSVNAVNPNAE